MAGTVKTAPGSDEAAPAGTGVRCAERDAAGEHRRGRLSEVLGAKRLMAARDIRATVRYVRPSALLTGVLLLASLFPLWVAWHESGRHLNDDSYITLAFARNIVRGAGFVFNHPPEVLGTTTPLFTLVVAGVAWALPGVELPAIAVLVSTICWIAIPWILFLARDRLGMTEWQATVVGLVMMASGWVRSLGMEAYLFSCLLVLGIVLFWSRRWILTGVVVGLLFLTRGEGALVACVLGTASLVREWARTRQLRPASWFPALSMAFGAAVPMLPWSVYACLTFGSPFPNTLPAKLAQYQAGNGKLLVERLAGEWLPAFGSAFAVPQIPLLNIGWLLVVAGLAYVLLRRREWVLFFIWILLYIAGYTVLQVAAYWWYWLPMAFVLHIAMGCGLVACMELVVRCSGAHRRSGMVVSAGLVLLAILMLGLPRVDSVLHHADDAQALSYIPLAQWIRNNTTPADTIASMEIGYLGYYTDNRVIDLAGLVTPDAVPHIAQGDYAWAFWHHKPDYFLYVREFDWALSEIHSAPRFAAEYQPVTTLQGPVASPVVVYRRMAYPE